MYHSGLLRFHVTNRVLVIAIILLGNTTLSAQQWSVPNLNVGKAMMTRWGRNLNPDQVLPEYPRPQMIRNGEWLNLNGYWELEIPDKNGSAPSQTFPILVPFPIESQLSGVATHATR
jgi:hypothetical protein